MGSKHQIIQDQVFSLSLPKVKIALARMSVLLYLVENTKRNLLWVYSHQVSWYST